MMKEKKNLEFKENIDTNSYLKTISAFANYGNGSIIFGITDAGDVVGVSDPQTVCLNLENRINDSIKPAPDYTLEIQEDSTIRLTVCEGLYKPYLYKGKAYTRHDTSTVEVDRLSYMRLILEGTNQTFEELPSEKQDLTFSILEKEFIQTMGIKELNQDVMKTLELYSDKDGYNHAAALLADRNEFKGIDIIRFGDTIDEIMERESFEGISILSQLNKSADMFRKYYQYERIESTERKLVDKIPEKAFREAIANALVHRTWDVKASIRVSMFQDRIEISSPGGLSPGISQEEYLHGQVSILRNPILGNVFFRLKYIEKFGTGILRINHAYADSIEKPSYRIFENSIQVVLPLLKSAESLTGFEKEILNLLRQHNAMSRAEISSKTGLEKGKTIRILNGMLTKNIILKQGSTRSVKYSLK